MTLLPNQIATETAAASETAIAIANETAMALLSQQSLSATMTSVPSPVVSATPTNAVVGALLAHSAANVSPKTTSTPLVLAATLVTVPNPGRNRIQAFYNLSGNGAVTLKLFDLAGREVASWNEGDQGTGTQQTWLNVSNLSNGVYFLSLNQDQGLGYHVKAVFKVALIK